MDIIIERGKTVALNELPEYSIALDGVVQGPELDTEHHRYSFDHHSGVLRYCTTSTSMQAWTAVMGGLDPQKYTAYCNDVDIDVCMAIWCLTNSDRCNEPQVKKLVEAVNLGDMHAGAIPLNGMAKPVDWVSAPQRDSIKNGDYEKLSNDGLQTVLESILHRIDQYVNGEAATAVAEQNTESEFKILRQENGWVLVESSEPHIYTKLYRAGFDRIILQRPQEDGSLACMLAKRTDFIDRYPIPQMLKRLDELEPGWGGGSTIGGPPRNKDGSRSRLSLDTILEVVNACIDNREVNLPKKRTPRKKSAKKAVTKKTATKKVATKKND